MKEVMQDITVRRMAFEFPDEIDPDFIPGEPERAYGIIGLSLLLPYLEPYLIRTMKVAKKDIQDPDLLVDLSHVSAQEGQHYREHIRFNKAVRLSGFPGLEALERDLEQDYLRFTEERSLRFNLAYAEGFEALTTAGARFAVESGDLSPDTAVGHLLAWHAVEELEHRTVAFDVYDHVCAGYFYRLAIGTFAQWHLLRFVGRVTRHMIEASPEIMARYGGKKGLRARQRKAVPMNLKILPSLAKTYLPGYTPHDIPFTDEMRSLAERYSAMARSTSGGGDTLRD